MNSDIVAGDLAGIASGSSRVEGFGGFVVRLDGVAPRIAISPALEVTFRAVQKRFGFLERLRRCSLRASLACRTDCLPGVAHFLNGRAGARRQRNAEQQESERTKRERVGHGGFFNRP
jgi:hypothetical protein